VFKNLLILSIVLFLAACGDSHVQVAESDDAVMQTEIFRGEDVSLIENPWQVSLRAGVFNQHICGGSLIAKNVVLTAAHCVDGKFRVFGGGNTGSGLQSDLLPLPRVKAVIVHPNYAKRSTLPGYDIAVVILASDVNFQTNPQIEIAPILPREFDKTTLFEKKAGERLYITGWGRTEFTSSPRQLQTTDLLHAQEEDFERIFKRLEEEAKESGEAEEENSEEPSEENKLWFENFLAAIDSELLIGVYHPEILSNACFGDSGGPMIKEFASGEKYLVGVTSFGFGDCGHISNYVNVNKFVDWIEEVVSQN